jgi:hypothetical protein
LVLSIKSSKSIPHKLPVNEMWNGINKSHQAYFLENLQTSSWFETPHLEADKILLCWLSLGVSLVSAYNQAFTFDILLFTMGWMGEMVDLMISGCLAQQSRY